MNGFRAAPILRHLRRLAVHQQIAVPDADLIQRYLDTGDQTAFAALVGRHGPMVLGVCRSVLHHPDDADDAFQATFIVLASKAGSVRRRDGLAGWLHGVARRVALNARAKSLRRAALEREAGSAMAASATDDLTLGEAREILHAELAALPERFRQPLVLCYLEGLTQDEAAERLGWSATTVKGRLQRGRDKLRVRLERRGIALVAALTATLTDGTLASPVSITLTETTTRIATQFATQTMTVSAAAALARDVLRQMGNLNGKVVSAILLTMGVATAGMTLWPEPPARKERFAQNPKQQPFEPRQDPHGDPLPDLAIARLGTLRFNHGDGLSNLRFTPNGKTIVSMGGGTLRRWDAVTGKELGTFVRGEPVWEEQIVLSADGTTLISLGQEPRGDTLRFWNFTQQQELNRAELPGHRRVTSIDIRNALSPDGRLALINKPEQVHVFEVETAKPLWTLPQTEANQQAAIFAGNDLAVIVDQKHAIEIREAATGESVRTFKQEAPAEVLAASPDGKWLATLEHHVHAIDKFLDKDVIHVWDIPTGTEKHQLGARPKRWYMNVLFTPDSKQLLAYSMGMVESELTVWDAQSGERLIELRDAVGQSMAVSPDGTRLAAGARSGRFSIFDLKNGRPVSDETGRDLQGAVVSLSARGERVLTANYKSISTWDVATSRRLPHGELSSDFSSSASRIHSSNLRYALSFVRQSESDETHVLVWDVAAGKCLYTLRFPNQWTQLSTAFSPDSSTLAIWQPAKETVVRLWTVQTGKEVLSFKESEAGWPGRLFFTPDGKTLIVAGKRIVGYDLASGRELFSWRLEPILVKSNVGISVGGVPVDPLERFPWRAFVISPDATVAACIFAGGFDRAPMPDRLALCDVLTGQIIRRWSDSGKPSNNYEELAFSPDGQLLASSDGTMIHLWEVATARELRTFHGHRGEICSLAFSGDGQRLASASNDSTVLVWDLIEARRK
jgi:RNA polymerase sigma factor (sigma-70 family)